MNTVIRPQTVQNCRWSASTLFLPKPYWLEAWDSPWSCWMRNKPRALMDTTDCARCPNWQAGEAKLLDPPCFC